MKYLVSNVRFRQCVCVWVIMGLLVLTVGLPSTRAAQEQTISASLEDDQPPIQKTQRTRDLESIQEVLEMEAIRERLEQLGFSVDEIKTKLRRLSDEQIHKMAQRLESVKAGGHADFPEPPEHVVVLILFIILLPVIAVVWLIWMLFHSHPHREPPGKAKGHKMLPSES